MNTSDMEDILIASINMPIDEYTEEKDTEASTDATFLEEEIDLFNGFFFKDIITTIENGFEFIEDNELKEPKENYTTIINFLNTTMNHFENLEHEFINKTSKKLSEDVNFLYQLYTNEKNKTYDVKEIFQQKFLKKSAIMRMLTDEILKLQSIADISQIDKKNLRRLIKDYTELKKIYFENFENIFEDERKYLLNSLLVILNSKAYYLDRMLWLEATESIALMRSFSPLNLTNSVNSKEYILHKLSTEPLSQNYKYLQECLRIYK